MLIWLCMGAVEVAADPPAIKRLFLDFGVQQPKQQRLAPDFTLPMLGGETISLKRLRGKVVLLHFWATWCPPCRHEIALLRKMEVNMRAKGLVVLYVNVDRGSRTVSSFVQQLSWKFQPLLDPDGVVRNRYAVRALPTTYLINRKGYIVGRIVGERAWRSPAADRVLAALVGQHASRP